MVTNKIKESIIRAAFDTARALRDAAERLEAAASMHDFARLSETSLTMGVWSVDQIKGAALVIVRSEDAVAATLPAILTDDAPGIKS
jgi:hypothetical protein